MIRLYSLLILRLLNILRCKKQVDIPLQQNLSPKEMIGNISPIIIDKLTIDNYTSIIGHNIFKDYIEEHEIFNDLLKYNEDELKRDINNSKKLLLWFLKNKLKKHTIQDLDDIALSSSNTNIYLSAINGDLPINGILKFSSAYLFLNIGNSDSCIRYSIISNIFDVKNETYIRTSLDHGVWTDYFKWDNDLKVAINPYEIVFELMNVKYSN